MNWLKPAIIVVAIIVLHYGTNSYYEPIKETIMGFFSLDEQEEYGSDLGSGTVTVLTDGANIRQAPDLNSAVITAVSKGETLVEHSRTTDSTGREWVSVEFASGEMGWVSGKIVE